LPLGVEEMAGRGGELAGVGIPTVALEDGVSETRSPRSVGVVWDTEALEGLEVPPELRETTPMATAPTTQARKMRFDFIGALVRIVGIAGAPN
jgi:hypothetical protein